MPKSDGRIRHTPRSGRVSERLEPVSGRTDGAMKYNGMEPFDRAGVRRPLPQARAEIYWSTLAQGKLRRWREALD